MFFYLFVRSFILSVWLMCRVLFWLAFVSSAYFRHSHKQEKTVKLQSHISYTMRGLAHAFSLSLSSSSFPSLYLTLYTMDVDTTKQSDSKNVSDVNSMPLYISLECRRYGGCGSVKYKVENTRVLLFRLYRRVS